MSSARAYNPGDSDPPVVSNANFAPGQTVANHAVVPVIFDEHGAPGIALRNSAGLTHVIVDVQGWYGDGTDAGYGLRFEPLEPERILDTRKAGGTAVPAHTTLKTPHGVLPPAAAHVVNVTATQGLGRGHVTAWSGDGPLPWTSTLNFRTGETSPNLATVGVGGDGRFVLTTGPSAVHLVADHLGFFY